MKETRFIAAYAHLLRASVAAGGLLLATEGHALDRSKLTSQYALEVWLARDGLPASAINAILQTHDGYLWLATHNGLVRFDGVRFTVMDSQTVPELKAQAFWVLAEDAEGSLWIGTEGRGLYRYRDGRFSSHLHDSGLVHRTIRALLPTRGVLWVGTYGDGLQHVQEGRFERLPTPDPHIRTILLDRRGSLWVGTQRGLVRNDPSESTPAGGPAVFGSRNGLPSDNVTALYEDRAGVLWVGTDKGLRRLTQGQWTSDPGAPSGVGVNAFLEDRHGNLWIGATSGLYRFNDGGFSRFGKPDGLSDDEILSLFEDREGSLWVGTRDGLNRFRDSPFFPFASSDGPFSDPVRALYPTRDGSVWINTDLRGLYRFQDGRIRNYTSRDGLYSDNGGPLYESRDGSLWIGTAGGLTRLKDGVLTPYPVEGGRYVAAISEDDRGLIVAVAQGGDSPLRRFQDGGLTAYTLHDGTPLRGISYIYSILPGADGTLWLATTEGLGQMKKGRYAPKYAGGPVYSTYEDRAGTVWLATQTGLVRYRDERTTVYTRAQGLPCEWLTGLAEDESGHLWLVCSRGILRVARRQLDDVAEGKAKAVSADFYGQSDGIRALDSARTTPLNVIRDSRGRLWFVGPKGPSIVDPRALPSNTLEPPVVIESVLADARPVRDGEELSPGRTSFQFQYTALSFRAPARMEFKYRLEGLDREWVHAGTRRIAFYSQIPPGNYRFRVTASNDSGLWNEEGASISFSLAPHFYQTVVFRVGVFLALVSTAGLLLRVRVRRSVQKVEDRFHTILAERNRMAHEFHDTFEQSLIGIKLQLEAAAAVQNWSEAAGRHLSRAYDLTLQSVSEAHHSIWALRSGILEYQEVEPALSALARQITAERGVRCRVEAKGDPVPLPQEVKDQILRIAQEAITNAVRHGRPANVVVFLTYEPRSVQLRVRDDGSGFDVVEGPSRNGGRFGLLGMRERAERLGGQMTLRSVIGEGTEVEVAVPIQSRGVDVERDRA